MELISVQVSIRPGVIHQQSFHGFYTYFSPAIAVGEGHRRNSVIYPPICKELACSVGCEFGPTIRR